MILGKPNAKGGEKTIEDDKEILWELIEAYVAASAALEDFMKDLK